MPGPVSLIEDEGFAYEHEILPFVREFLVVLSISRIGLRPRCAGKTVHVVCGCPVCFAIMRRTARVIQLAGIWSRADTECANKQRPVVF